MRIQQKHEYAFKQRLSLYLHRKNVSLEMMIWIDPSVDRRIQLPRSRRPNYRETVAFRNTARLRAAA